jgi:hypothetical protein
MASFDSSWNLHVCSNADVKKIRKTYTTRCITSSDTNAITLNKWYNEGWGSLSFTYGGGCHA